jgi:predicted transcriptional regulator
MAESTSIKLRDGMRERLKTVAGKKNRTPNWVMREAIEKYLTR